MDVHDPRIKNVFYDWVHFLGIEIRLYLGRFDDRSECVFHIKLRSVKKLE